MAMKKSFSSWNLSSGNFVREIMNFMEVANSVANPKYKKE
jgi:hypothetical protein